MMILLKEAHVGIIIKMEFRYVERQRKGISLSDLIKNMLAMLMGVIVKFALKRKRKLLTPNNPTHENNNLDISSLLNRILSVLFFIAILTNKIHALEVQKSIQKDG